MGVKFTGSNFEIYVIAFLTYVSHRNLLRMGQICSHNRSLGPQRCIFRHFHKGFVLHNNLPCLLELPEKTKNDDLYFQFFTQNALYIHRFFIQI